MQTIIAIVLINICPLLVFFLLWNNVEHRIPFKQIILFAFAFNLSIVSLWVLTGFSLSDFMVEWSKLFTHSLSEWHIYFSVIMILFVSLVTPFLFHEFKLLVHCDNRKYIVVGIIFLLVAIGLWIPFGFESVAQWEGWIFKDYLQVGPPFRITSQMITRLSGNISFTIAHLIDPYGFTGDNLLHWFSFFLKGVLFFAILKKFNINDTLSFVICLLFMIYPSNTEVMSLRTSPLNFYTISFLFSIYVFLVYVKKQSVLGLAIFFITMFITVTISEYGFLHILLFPFLLFYFERRINYKVFNLSVIWYLIPMWYVGYYYLTASYMKVYGESYVKVNNLSVELQKTLDTIARSFDVLLIEDWRMTLSTAISSDYIFITITLMIMIFITVYIILQDTDRQNSSLSPNLVNLFIVGVIWMFCAALLFGMISARRNSDWRIYILGSMGASIVISTLLFQLVNKLLYRFNPRLVFLASGVLLFGLAFQHSIHQHQYYWNIAKNKANFVDFAKNYESVSPSATWIFLTDMTSQFLTEQLDVLYTKQRITISALKVTNNDIALGKVTFCSFSDMDCSFHSKRVHTNDAGKVPYDEIVFFWMETDFSVRLLETIPDEPWQLSYAKDFYQPLKYIKLKNGLLQEAAD